MVMKITMIMVLKDHNGGNYIDSDGNEFCINIFRIKGVKNRSKIDNIRYAESTYANR